MKLKDRLEATRWFKQRVAFHHGAGKPIKDAIKLAEADGEKKFGADWATIFEFLKMLIPLLLSLFGK